MRGRSCQKYVPLCSFIERLPEEQLIVRLTFSEIERLIAASLPSSALLQQYWRNNQIARANWAMIGWHGRLERPRAIVFTRSQSPAAA